MMLDAELLRGKLNLETGRLDWPALARHFARGVVIKVAADMDLVAVATAFCRDDKSAVGQWLTEGKIAKADDADAQAWQAGQTTFWAVVVAPWVLVQVCQPGALPD
jgi:hypothetical protein